MQLLTFACYFIYVTVTSGPGSEAGPMKSFHDVMCVFSCFSNPPVRFFFSHVKLASNQFDVDNFAFISVLTDSLAVVFIPDLPNSQHSAYFFLAIFLLKIVSSNLHTVVFFEEL